MTRCLLIDADIVAYKASAVTEKRYDWGDDVVSVVADLEAAKAHAKNTIEELMDTLNAHRLIICLSDDWRNFRKTIEPTYKTNRTGPRPEELYSVKEWLEETYTARRVETLEADDVMGILATRPSKEDRIIVSEDKDMQTVPALLYNPNKPELKVRQISPEDAERFHLWQTITGDQTDGYPGCPGAGPQAAEKLLAGIGWESYVHTFKSGPRKGLEETRWREAEMGRWPAIVSAYQKAGLKERDAVRQARLAFILRDGYYENGKVRMWSPSEKAN